MNKLINFLKLFLYLFIILTTFKVLIIYPGNKVIYLIFTFISTFHLLYSLRPSSYFVDKFVSIFIWLGFWFKFSFEFGYQLWGPINFREGIGVFDQTGNSYDQVLIIASVGISGFIVASYFSKFLFPRHLINSKNIKNYFFEYYKKYIYLTFFLIVILVSYLNIHYGIYQKGLVSNENINIYVSYLVRWFLLFGFTSVSCILIYLEINNKVVNHKLVFLLFIESFISNLSLLSRSAIFNFISLIYGLFYYLKTINFKRKTFYILILFSLVLFFLNIFSVNKLRDEKYYKSSNLQSNRIIYQNINYLDNNFYLAGNFSLSELRGFNLFDLRNDNIFSFITKNIDDIKYLVTNRWVGIDALMAVSAQKKILSFDLIQKSFEEKFIEDEYSYFEKNFLLRLNKSEENKKLNRSNAVILPGIIAYLYFSGSKIFIFISIISIMFLCFFLERVTYLLSFKNLILTSFMGYIFASRLVHSGYLVSNNIKYLIAIIINLIAVYIVMIMLRKFNKIYKKKILNI